MHQKAAYEVITTGFGTSFYYQSYHKEQFATTRGWHYHPEIELVYINGGSGKRQIGSHISYYTGGDLILIGSNLPHCGFSDGTSGSKRETIIQLKSDFMGDDFLNKPEMAAVRNLFKMASGGLAFGPQSQVEIGALMEKMEAQGEFDRFITLLRVLDKLSKATDFRVLNGEGYALHAEVKDNDRVNIIFDYVRNHFKEQISLDEIADQVSMTKTAFCRYFKKVTNKTFVQFVNEYRLVHASRLLAEQPISITEVCYESGFNNFSHFNKLFKGYTGQNPSEYRYQHKNILQT